MQYSPALLPDIIQAIAEIINDNAEVVMALDQAIGDGDHVVNLQRGIDALTEQSSDLSNLNWPEAWQKIGMTLLTTMGGASGSLFGTLFISMSKAAKEKALDPHGFAEIFSQGVESVKQRGKAEAGEKTMLDVLIPVADKLLELAPASTAMAEVFDKVDAVAIAGVESTRDMIATKGRASYLGERTRGHIDAGAQTSQLMIAAIISVLSAAPA